MDLPYVQVRIAGRNEWLAIEPNLTAAGLIGHVAQEVPRGQEAFVVYMEAEVPPDAILSKLVGHKDVLSVIFRPQQHSATTQEEQFSEASPLVKQHAVDVARWPKQRIAFGVLFSVILSLDLGIVAGFNIAGSIDGASGPRRVLLPLAIGLNYLLSIGGLLSFATSLMFLPSKTSRFFAFQIAIVGLLETAMFSLLAAFFLVPGWQHPIVLIVGILFAVGGIYPLWGSLQGCGRYAGGSVLPYSGIQIGAFILSGITFGSAFICLLVVVITSESVLTGTVFLYEGLFGRLNGEVLAIGRASAFFTVLHSIMSPGWYLVSTQDVLPVHVLVVQLVLVSISTLCQTALIVVYPLLYVGWTAGGLDTGVLVLSAFSFVGTVSATIGISRRLIQQYHPVLSSIQ